MNALLQWLAPVLSSVLSALVIYSGQRALEAKFRAAERQREQADRETEEERRERREWRESVDKRLEKLASDNQLSLEAQCSQMRSDIIHKAHRYLDDLGRASVEEKQSFNTGYEDYLRLCKTLGIENHFVDGLVERVMALPEREI